GGRCGNGGRSRHQAARDSAADEARPRSRERAYPGSGAEQPHVLHTRGPLSQTLESYPRESAEDARPRPRSSYDYLAIQHLEASALRRPGSRGAVSRIPAKQLHFSVSRSLETKWHNNK